MVELQNLQELMNPWALQLQKLGLELKCPLCLKLLNKPVLLPCNHMFCNICISRFAKFGSECPACKHQYDDQEMRSAPYMENIVTIYRSLDAISNSVFQPLHSDQSRVSFVSNLSDGTKGFPSEALMEQVAKGSKVISLTANESNQAFLNACVNDQISPVGKIDKSANSTCKGAASFERLEMEEMDMNQVPQLSPESPPSFGDTKDMGGNITDSGSRESSMAKSTVKRSVEHLLDAAGGDTSCSALQNDDFAKRQKTLTYCPSDTGGRNSYHREEVSYSDNLATSKGNLRPGQGRLPFAESTTPSDSSYLNRSVCALCHSSKITEGTGKMTYFANGREVEGDLSMVPNVIAVHIKCIDWTPRVFYEGDTIKNLESELERAAKLKCSSCGLKGAALGCFTKSCRRTYHVPCAYEIQECRWDCDDFLMLCPLHNSFKFPRERSKMGKSARVKVPVSVDSTQITSKECKFWSASPSGRQEWVLCGSALSPQEKYLLVKFAAICGATISKFWRPNVTHVIAAMDEKGACTRTLKVLMAILNGRWILTMDWIKACMEANLPVNEEPYEVRLDNHGCLNGPKTGRLRILNNAPKLFDGLKFYFSGEFLPAYKVDLLDLVRTAGGTIIGSKEQLMMESLDLPAVSTSLLVVYNSDIPRGCAVGQEKLIVLQRFEEATCMANATNSQVIQHTWILESIAACKLHPVPSKDQKAP